MFKNFLLYGGTIKKDFIKRSGAEMDKEQLQKLYQQEGYYWGKKPNQLAARVLECLPAEQRKGAKAVDLGAGEGRDSVYLAAHGLDVWAVDIAPAGLAKAHSLAQEQGTSLRTLAADLNHVELPEKMDVVYSIGALQYIHPENRERQFRHFQEQTHPGGWHVLLAFVEHPDVAIAPDWGNNEYLYGREELQAYYSHWQIRDTYE
jgi:tellurite methyltransferase